MHPKRISRRRFVQTCGALGAVLRSGTARADALTVPLDGDWEFTGKGGVRQTVAIPHCVAKLSWQDWDPAAWEDVWHYRKRFSLPRAASPRRVFLEFDGVMVGATPSINGHALAEHLGGYLPFRYEITEWVRGGENVLDVEVDARWRNVPPEGSPKGPSSIDYLEPGGIIRGARVTLTPEAFVSDVFAKSVGMMSAGRRVEVACTVDGAGGTVRAELRDGARVLTSGEREGSGTIPLAIPRDAALWTPEAPRLYEVVVTLRAGGKAVHERRVRTGFREARFTADGFFLNGERLRLFGLNRHEIYPYAGAAMPARVLRRDAEILRRDFHCNIVRCSHYPQSEAFLDACDELGLMVWEEIPGWQYLGDAEWKDLAVRDTREMVKRDRNHPAIVVWGVRVNESANDVELYRRTTEAARELDDSRPASGSMTSQSTKNWQEDVFAFDDYHAAPDGTVGIREPVAGVPYMLAEAVGQFNYARGRNFDAKYRRTEDVGLQQAQAVRHAQAHDRAAAFPRCGGVIAWCAFDYGSLVNSYRGVKYPGVADVFRVPKLGASFYQSQVSPRAGAVIAPNFFWDGTPLKGVAIFSNCERLEIQVGGRKAGTLLPDREGYPRLAYPPFFGDLSGEGDLRIDGYIEGKLAATRWMSGDRKRDQFVMKADDLELTADGADATRVAFQAADRFGNLRAGGTGDVTFMVDGPGVLVGDNPFHLGDSGGAGAVWVRSVWRRAGTVLLRGRHSEFGVKAVTVRIRE